MLEKIKLFLRRNHNKLDSDIQADIYACLADLRGCGVIYADMTNDPLIFNAVKLWCKSLDVDDVAKSAEFFRRYEALKGSLMMMEGYGREASDE